MDYGYAIYDQPSSFTLSYKIESTKYNATLAIIVYIRATSKGKLYYKLSLESLKDRRVRQLR